MVSRNEVRGKGGEGEEGGRKGVERSVEEEE